MAEMDFFVFPLAYAVANVAYATREGHPERHLLTSFPTTSVVGSGTLFDQPAFLSDLKLRRLHPGFVVFTLHDTTAIVGFTGTNDAKSIMDDASAATVERDLSASSQNGSTRRLTVGFHNGFRTRAEALFPEVEKSIKPYLDNKYRIIFTGHSLGGATAAIVTLMLYLKYPDNTMWPCEAGTRLSGDHDNLPPAECFSIGFGSPVPGDARLANAIEQLGIRRVFYTFVNENDFIPRAYNVSTGMLSRFLHTIGAYLMSPGSAAMPENADGLISSVSWNPESSSSSSPAFGTYVFLADPEGNPVVGRGTRDRDIILQVLQSTSGGLEEHGRSWYGRRIGAVRNKALQRSTEWPAMKSLRLPDTLKEALCPNFCRWTNGTSATLFLGYNVAERCVVAANWQPTEASLCFTIDAAGLIKKLSPSVTLSTYTPGRLHVRALVKPNTLTKLALVTALGAQELEGSETELVSETALADVDRSLLPCVQQVMSHVTPTLHALVYVTLKALPDDGLRQVVLRHNARSALTFVLTLPKEHFEKLSFQLTNCTAVRRASSSDADSVEMHMTVPANVSGGYAVLAEYVSGEVDDWELARISAATPSVSAPPRQSTPSSPPSSPSSPAVRPLAPTKLSLSDRAFLLRFEAKWKIKRLFKGY